MIHFSLKLKFETHDETQIPATWSGGKRPKRSQLAFVPLDHPLKPFHTHHLFHPAIAGAVGRISLALDRLGD